MYTEELKKGLVEHRSWGWWGALVAFLSYSVRQDLCKVGRALANLADLEQHVKSNLGEIRKRKSRERSLSGILEGKCSEICVELELLRKILIES